MKGRISFEPQFHTVHGYNNMVFHGIEEGRPIPALPSDMFIAQVACSFWFYNKRLEEDEAALSGALRGEL